MRGVYKKVLNIATRRFRRGPEALLSLFFRTFAGIENGKPYCGAQRATAEEKHPESVTVNGIKIELGADRSFTLAPAGGKQTAFAADKAGNVTQITVTAAEESAPRTPGDVDGEGKITMADCLYLKRGCLGTFDLSNFA